VSNAYVHGYDAREGLRLQDQASTLIELLHADTSYPAGSHVLEVGCGVGAQTVILARNSPNAVISSVDISEVSLAKPGEKSSSRFHERSVRQGDIFRLPFKPDSFDHVFVCFVLEHLSHPVEALKV